MKIEKIKKLQNKEMVKVAGQENCQNLDKPRIYTPGQDCLNDCEAQTRPAYYMSLET